MTTPHHLDLVISICLLSVTLKLSINGFRSLLFLRRANAQRQKPFGPLPYFAILIPVLREQSVIAETIRHFAAIDYPCSLLRIVLITTEREQWERDQQLSDPDHALPLTSTIIDKTIEAVNAALGTPVARRIHYPFTKGHMAHQVNYAVRYLFEVIDEGIDPSSVFVALYNADSRPDPDVLNIAANLIASAPDRHVALQQHSIYRTAGTPAAFEGAVLQAARLWQTRWSLCVEIPRAIRTKALLHPRALRLQRPPWSQLRALLLPFNYAIGHGLFVRLRELVLLNYMPEMTRNEDAPFGYLLLLAGIPLVPLPCTDNAEVPRSVPSLVTQQSNWYRGPLDAMLYLRMARARRLVDSRSLQATILTVRTLYDAVVWLVGPCLFLLAILPLPFLPSHPFLLGVFGLFFLLPSIPAVVRLAPGSSPTDLCQAFLALPLFYLVHGLGAILGTHAAFVELCRGRAMPKLKTER
jgi:cellulose synthase/poly-beta-1,6-N-acetylglucosamine synthase-like glycosyltransferase